jgi:chorismate dehydratase
MTKLKLAAVSYLNTKPFLAGLAQSPLSDLFDIQLAVPSECANLFESGEVDIALVPVASLLHLSDYQQMTRFCIGADGKVDSVYLFAQHPATSIQSLYLDSHSNTSNNLARLLFDQHWQTPVITLGHLSEMAQIDGPTAGVVIGDKAVLLKDRFRYCYDLAYEWKLLTGLPFVFAVWVYRPATVSMNIVESLEAAFGNGLAQTEAVARKWAGHFNMSFDKALHYLTQSIQYQFSDDTASALALYLSEIAAYQRVRE